MIQRLATTLLTTLRQDQQRLEQAAQNQDGVTLSQAAHRIKGSLLMLQLPAAASLCQQLGDNGREGTLMQAAYNELSALVAQILIELNDLVSTDETYFAMDKDE
jgi:two-component system sensor histidine kinase EvgS